MSVEFLVNLIAPVRLVNGLNFTSRSGARVISLTSSSNLTVTKDLNFEACARNIELLKEECPHQKPYCLAKLGVLAMSKHFATTRGKHDGVVTVSADPGAVATPMLHSAHEKFSWEVSVERDQVTRER